MGEPWMRWAVLEGLSKTVGRLLQKFLGMATGSLAGSLFVVSLVGVVQALGGFIGARWRRAPLLATKGRIAGGVLFGLVATAMTVLAVFIFTFTGADIGIATFIVTLSIIPGALIDWAFFQHPLRLRQWLGLAAFIGAGYAMLNFPSGNTLLALPTWMWLAGLIALLAAVNEAISQAVRAMDPFVNNFWVGVTTIAASAVWLSFSGLGVMIGELRGSFWLAVVIFGLVVTGGVVFKLLSYKGGGSIALKKLIMQGTYLITATLLGVLFYAEPFTAGKTVGITGFVLAFTLMDQGTWEFFRRAYLSAFAVTR